MGLPRVRFTVRGLTVAVMLAGLLLGGGAWHRRRIGFLRWATMYARSEANDRRMAADERREAEARRAAGELGRARDLVQQAAGDEARAEHWAKLRRKYERLARYPWLTAEPDPFY